MADTPVWDPAAAKYDFTAFAGGSRTESDPLGQILVEASSLGTSEGLTGRIAAPYLFQDMRSGPPGHGLGIGPDFEQEINGNEMLVVTATPEGSAQGVSGVWLSNLYCGNDGANSGLCDSSDSPSNNQWTGEQASVEVDYIDPAHPGAVACQSFLALGVDNLSDSSKRGEVYVDFGGEVLQMTAARFSARVSTDYESGECRTDSTVLRPPVSNNEFSVLGFVLDESIEVAVCSGGQSCDAINIPGLKATIPNAPSGTFTLENSYFAVDGRGQCRSDGLDVAVPGQRIVDGRLEIDVNGDADYDIIIPANLCGIPRQSDGIPQIWIQNVASVLQQQFYDQIVEIEVENPENTAFFCHGNSPTQQPVLAWIPRWDDPTEIPVFKIGSPRSVSRVVQDATAACGSYRSRSRALSYLVGNLHYIYSTDFEEVVTAEVARLNYTIQETDGCRLDWWSKLKLYTGGYLVERAVDKGNYRQARNLLQAFDKALERRDLKSDLLSCKFNLDTDTVLPASATGANVVPALFWSYLEVQIDHLIFQLENKLL